MKENQNTAIYKNRVRTYFSKPQNVILLLFGIILTFTTIAPIVAIVKDTLTIHPGTIDAVSYTHLDVYKRQGSGL